MTTESQHTVHKGKGHERLKDIIEEIGCCTPGHYCTLKEILLRSHRDTRTLVQIRCIEKFKYERSEQAKRDIGWTEAFERWIDEGRAAAFSRLFRDDVRIGELYQQIMKDPAT